jgi:hypothetical protein
MGVAHRLSAVVAVAKRELYVIAMVTDSADKTIDTVRVMRDRIARMLPDPPKGASGASTAELQVVELGITVARRLGT